MGWGVIGVVTGAALLLIGVDLLTGGQLTRLVTSAMRETTAQVFTLIEGTDEDAG